MCVTACFLVFNQIRYEHSHQIKSDKHLLIGFLTYPSGDSTVLTYTSESTNFGGGSKVYYFLSSSKDIISGEDRNTITYSRTGNSYNASYYNSLSDYYKQSNSIDDYSFQIIVTTTAGASVYVFNEKCLYTYYSSGYKVEENLYNSYDLVSKKNVKDYGSSTSKNSDGNGRMSRLLTTLLLYRSGFYVGKYISLEAKIAKNKDLYYDTLRASQNGWYEGNEDIAPFLKYLLGTILAAYKDFEDRFSLVETKHPALETVRLATQQKIGHFSKQDIRELCPSLSLSSLEGALRKMVASGELRREGNGKNTRYYRLK